MPYVNNILQQEVFYVSNPTRAHYVIIFDRCFTILSGALNIIISERSSLCYGLSLDGLSKKVKMLQCSFAPILKCSNAPMLRLGPILNFQTSERTHVPVRPCLNCTAIALRHRMHSFSPFILFFFFVCCLFSSCVAIKY